MVIEEKYTGGIQWLKIDPWHPRIFHLKQEKVKNIIIEFVKLNDFSALSLNRALKILIYLITVALRKPHRSGLNIGPSESLEFPCLVEFSFPKKFLRALLCLVLACMYDGPISYYKEINILFVRSRHKVSISDTYLSLW